MYLFSYCVLAFEVLAGYALNAIKLCMQQASFSTLHPCSMSTVKTLSKLKQIADEHMVCSFT